jgi:protein-tyrosine phosphatase
VDGRAAAGPSTPARFNLRDLGGLRLDDGGSVRHGCLFRGASLHRLEPENRQELDSLGVHLAIDLRSPQEVARGMFVGDGVEVVNLPIFEVAPVFEDEIEDPAETLAETYVWMLEQGRDAIASIFALLAEPTNLPVVIYCAAGKDRTGVVCALILRLIGVKVDAVAGDYRLSQEPTQALKSWHERQVGSDRDPHPAAVYTAPEEAMRRFLDDVDGIYGSVAGYLGEIGVPTTETRIALRRSLVA